MLAVTTVNRFLRHFTRALALPVGALCVGGQLFTADAVDVQVVALGVAVVAAVGLDIVVHGGKGEKAAGSATGALEQHQQLAEQLHPDVRALLAEHAALLPPGAVIRGMAVPAGMMVVEDGILPGGLRLIERPATGGSFELTNDQHDRYQHAVWTAARARDELRKLDESGVDSPRRRQELIVLVNATRNRAEAESDSWTTS